LSIRFQADNDFKFGIVKAVRGESQASIFCLPKRLALTVFPIRSCWTAWQQKAESWCLMIGER
jgi:hypothetical protein